MKVEMRMQYEAPEVEVLEVEIEVGFAGTGGGAVAGGVGPEEKPW